MLKNLGAFMFSPNQTATLWSEPWTQLNHGLVCVKVYLSIVWTKYKKPQTIKHMKKSCIYKTHRLLYNPWKHYYYNRTVIEPNECNSTWVSSANCESLQMRKHPHVIISIIFVCISCSEMASSSNWDHIFCWDLPLQRHNFVSELCHNTFTGLCGLSVANVTPTVKSWRTA